MPNADNAFLGAGAREGGESRGGVPEVVKAGALETGRFGCRQPHPLAEVSVEACAGAAGEDERVGLGSDELVEVERELVYEGCGPRHGPPAGPSLRRCCQNLARVEPDALPPDGDG